MNALLGLGTFGTFVTVVGFILLPIIGMWKFFAKAGKPGWFSIIPLLNVIMLIDIAKKPIWWIILFLIPVINIIIMFLVLDGISKAFGKSTAFTLGLFFFPFIFYLILAFGSATYSKS